MQNFDGDHEAAQLLPQGQWQSRDASLKHASGAIRRGFVRKVYGVLSMQLLVTFVVASYVYAGGQNSDWLRSHEWLLWVSVFATFASICLMSCCEQVARTYPTNYIFLFVFTFFEAIMIGFVSATFTWQSVLLAAGVTVLVFLGLTLYAFNSAVDFTGSAPYLFAALLCFALFGLLLAVLPLFGVSIDIGVAIYDCIGVMLFSFFIVFDTQLMLGEWGGHKLGFSVDDYVFAALNLYMDIINIFLHLLSLLGDRKVE
eukprot:CAMPEP_0204057612 /NCGR_PEP_ID=MMETSP0360-20130528/134421_1 /ASSEMBLY_ACC=CAM_ASM_000342 /TAXON_ID=268821 /ORGANISM="Scrippsiella Hangoei, Strain SHTV-5" /LENGTH=256 /DNA_ID=CAMNT_0051005101 /DNA_START=36 /DNA_END=804 /DNA_ORIENTATION=-